MACYLLLTLKVTYRVISNLVDLTQFNFGDLVVQERYTEYQYARAQGGCRGHN